MNSTVVTSQNLISNLPRLAVRGSSALDLTLQIYNTTMRLWAQTCLGTLGCQDVCSNVSRRLYFLEIFSYKSLTLKMVHCTEQGPEFPLLIREQGFLPLLSQSWSFYYTYFFVQSGIGTYCLALV